eukprot:scaffold120129_cov54-Phaeocystis_antarctica.AAC.1
MVSSARTSVTDTSTSTSSSTILTPGGGGAAAAGQAGAMLPGYHPYQVVEQLLQAGQAAHRCAVDAPL